MGSSVNLTIAMKHQILEMFFKDLMKKNRPKLEKIRTDAGKHYYNVLYPPGLRRKLANLPRAFWTEENWIPLGHVTDWRLKDKRERMMDSNMLVMPVFRQSYQKPYQRGSQSKLILERMSDRWGGITWEKEEKIPLPEKKRQSAHRWFNNDKIDMARQYGLITGDQAIQLEKEMSEFIHEAQEIVDAVDTVFVGVVDILRQCRTTKKLYEIWPEAKKYLKVEEAVPETANIVPVSVVKLNEAISHVL